jgi:hypothetical protein
MGVMVEEGVAVGVFKNIVKVDPSNQRGGGTVHRLTMVNLQENSEVGKVDLSFKPLGLSRLYGNLWLLIGKQSSEQIRLLNINLSHQSPSISPIKPVKDKAGYLLTDGLTSTHSDLGIQEQLVRSIFGLKDKLSQQKITNLSGRMKIKSFQLLTSESNARSILLMLVHNKVSNQDIIAVYEITRVKSALTTSLAFSFK